LTVTCKFSLCFVLQLLTGGSEDLISKLHLKKDPSSYHYTNQGGDWKVTTINDRKLFRDVEQALKSMGVGAAESETLWKVVAAVLHLVRINSTV